MKTFSKIKMPAGSNILALAFAILLIAFFSFQTINAATLVVTNENDSGEGSLRQTIADAEHFDNIIFNDDVNHIILTSGEIVITKFVYLSGGTGNKRVIIDGNNNSRIFASYGIIPLEINNLTITKGCTTDTSQYGGAIYVCGPFKATLCDFTDNTGASYGGVISASH